MASIIFHIDVNSAYLSWTAVEQLKNGAAVDLREIPAIIGGDQKSRHGVVLAKSPAAKKFVAEAGYDPYFGARPLRRAVQKYIEDPVSEFIISLMQKPSHESPVPDIPVLTVGISQDRKSTEIKMRHAELCAMQP